MDKVFSTRLDESIIRQVGLLARQLGMTKKAVIQKAIQTLAEKVEVTHDMNVWKETCGAWQRRELPETTVQKAREAFEESIKRHHQ